MKIKILIFFCLTSIITGCVNLDLNPLSQASTGNWYSNESEIEMSIQNLYRIRYWSLWGEYNVNGFSDDDAKRNDLSIVTGGTINGQSPQVVSLWSYSYEAIARANIIIEKLESNSNSFSEESLNKYKAETRFLRASLYANLITYFGDVVYCDKSLSIAEAFATGKTDKKTILGKIYEDYDFAAKYLPVSYGSNELRRATKGTVLAMKARIALYNQDWEIASNAAKSCIDLGVYKLHTKFDDLFYSKSDNSDEVIFSIPRNTALGVGLSDAPYFCPRNTGGNALCIPSWDLLCSFLCTDGLPIDESPLFDPHNPFKNRDPRCAATIVEFGTQHLGFIYQPHPDSLRVWNASTNSYQVNNDSRGANIYASYTGLLWKKGIDSDWMDDKIAQIDKFIIRYADVLLIYAEARIELNQIDQSVLDAMNMVRARAYGVDKSASMQYPKIIFSVQSSLRKILRIERRMEFAFEPDLRHMDIIRWRLAGKVLNTPIYGMIDPSELRPRITSKGLWFFPETPQIDDDGIPDFSTLYNKGYTKILAVRTFDVNKQYVWPIPTKEILTNNNLTQNPGY